MLATQLVIGGMTSAGVLYSKELLSWLAKDENGWGY